MSRRPNLLFVLVDQMRWHAMGCAGDANARTPVLDRLAAEGASFDRAVSNIPVCTPARACLLTGRYPLSHTVLTNNSRLPEDIPSLGGILRAAGYRTGYIGKWHLAGEAFIGATPHNHGRDGWVPPGAMRHGFDHWQVHHCTHDYWHPTWYEDQPVPCTRAGFEPDVQTDLALDFIRRPGADPFALVVAWGTPHTPFTAPPADVAAFPPERLELRRNVRCDPAIIHCDHHDRALEGQAPESVLRRHLAHYYGAIANLDRNLGRLLAALAEQGRLDDTLVVFTSDHGEMLGSHGHMHKLQPWDESILVPLLLRLPGSIRPGRRHAGPINQPDVLPTVLSLLGVPAPGGIEGIDHAPLLAGAPLAGPPGAFLIWPCNAVTWGKRWTDINDRRGFPAGFRMREYRGVRTLRHTYVRDRTGPWMLYDNERDPWQQDELIARLGPGAVPPELDRLLDGWLERTNDGFADTAYYRDRIDLETGLATAPLHGR